MFIPCISLLFVFTFAWLFQSEGKEIGVPDDAISINYDALTMRQKNATARCGSEECPQKTMVVFLILSKKYPFDKFNKLKEFVGLVVKSCNFSQYDVSFTYTGFHNVFDWRTDVASFDELQRTMPSDEFEWTLPPTPKELSYSVHLLVDSIGSVKIPDTSAFIMIMTDYELYVTDENAEDIRELLEEKVSRLEIVQLSRENNNQSSRSESNNVHLDQMVGEGRVIEVDHVDDLRHYANSLALCNKTIALNPWDRRKRSASDWVTNTIVSILIIMFAVLILAMFYNKSRRKWKADVRRFSETLSVSQRTSSTLASVDYYEMQFTDKWSINAGKLNILYDKKLGSGAFCCVYKGKLSGTAPVCKVSPSIQLSRTYTDCDVAVKMLPPYTDDLAKSDFIQEINFMKSLSYHPHLISMLGTCWQKSEIYLITEYCAYGDLLHYIRDKKHKLMGEDSDSNSLTVRDMLCFAWQISDGMDYLSSRGCIHRDLAARNVLVDHMNTAKIGDFGLCRFTDSCLYTTRGGRLPIKWMALESLRSYEYSTKSDVWSFGVVLFEIFSMGGVPFPLVQPCDMISHLESGNRLEKPLCCTDEIYTIMQSCWRENAADRPSFDMVRRKLTAIMENYSVHYGYLALNERKNSHSDSSIALQITF